MENDGELRDYVRENVPGDWQNVWARVRADRRACLRRLQECAERLYGERGMSEVRFRLELEYIVRLIEENGP